MSTEPTISQPESIYGMGILAGSYKNPGPCFEMKDKTSSRTEAALPDFRLVE